MAENFGIQQLRDPMGSGGESNYSPGYMNLHAQKKAQANNLNTGDIVQGLITEVFGTSEAVVRLQSGTYRAVIHSGLKKGDNIIFKVAETQPSLVLKIYGVNIVQDRELNNKELARIFNLPLTDTVDTIFDFLREKSSTVYKDKLLLLIKHWSVLNDAEPELELSALCLQTIDFFNEISANINIEEFGKLSSVFSGLNEISAKLEKLESYLNIRFEKELSPIKRIFSGLRNKVLTNKEIFNFFSANRSVNQTEPLFIELLAELKSIRLPALSDRYGEAMKTADEIIRFIGSLEYYNSLAVKSGKPLWLILPVLFRDRICLTKYILRDTAVIRELRENFKLHFQIETVQGKVVNTAVSFSSGLLDIRYTDDSGDVRELTEHNIVFLVKMLSGLNYIIKKVTVSKDDGLPQEHSNVKVQEEPKRISFKV